MYLFFYTYPTERVAKLVANTVRPSYARNIRWGCQPDQYDLVFFLYLEGDGSSFDVECIKECNRQQKLCSIEVEPFKSYREGHPYHNKSMYLDNQYKHVLDVLSRHIVWE